MRCAIKSAAKHSAKTIKRGSLGIHAEDWSRPRRKFTDLPSRASSSVSEHDLDNQYLRFICREEYRAALARHAEG